MTKVLEKKLLTHLEQIYPESDNGSLSAQIIKLMRFNEKIAEPRQQYSPWSEKDIITITYADTFLNPPEMPLTTLKTFLNKHFKDFVTSVHVLPFYPYSSDDGFSVINYTEVNPAWGNWDEIEEIGQEFKLMADLIVNHCSAKSKWFENFIDDVSPGKGFFFTEASAEDDLSLVTRPRTNDLLRKVKTKTGEQLVWCTFSHDQVDLNFKNPQVLLEFVKIIRFYLDKGVQIFRLDAIAFLWKEIGTTCLNLPQTHEFVRLFRTIIEHANPNAVLITETNIPNRENLSYFGNGNEAHMVYNFSLPPLLVQALLTGDCHALKNWLMSLPPAQMGTTYFNMIASHDGIGLRPAEGLLSEEEIDELVDVARCYGGEISSRALENNKEKPYELNISLYDLLKGTVDEEDEFNLERFICAHAIMLSLQGIPAFYIQSLLGTSNAKEKYMRWGYNRALNRKNWDLNQLEELFDDKDSTPTRVKEQIKSLVQVRKRQIAFHPNAPQYTLHLGDSIFALKRISLDNYQSLVILSNITKESQTIPLSEINLKDDFSWCDLLSDLKIDNLQEELTINPYQSIWLSNRRF